METKMNKLYETITAENWCKNVIYDGNGRYCLVGHMLNLYGDGAAYIDALTKTKDAILMLYPERVMQSHVIARSVFNNHSDTTVEDVIRVCKVADV